MKPGVLIDQSWLSYKINEKRAAHYMPAFQSLTFQVPLRR